MMMKSFADSIKLSIKTWICKTNCQTIKSDLSKFIEINVSTSIKPIRINLFKILVDPTETKRI